MTLLALIPARGGSKGIPRKNILPFCGKPLLQWSIDTAKASNCVDQVVVSTDDLEIASLARAGGAEVPYLRPAEFATDEAPGIAPVLHALEQLPHVTDGVVATYLPVAHQCRYRGDSELKAACWGESSVSHPKREASVLDVHLGARKTS